ncbi:MAG: hypothetical protein ACXVP5_09125 [Tumebacillaceae bacterium]
MSECKFQSLMEPRVEETENFIGELAMLLPVYVEGGGDMTKVVLRAGTSWLDPRPVPAVLRQIARYFGVDLTAVRERYGDILGRKLHVPIPLAPQLVLMPLKMRTPRIQKDGTTGYIATDVVQRVIPDVESTRCKLEVEGNGRVECLQSSEFAKQQLRNARIVKQFYQERLRARAMV